MATLPASWSTRLYACELSEEDCVDMASIVDSMLVASDTDGELQRLVQLLRLWCEHARVDSSASNFWSIISQTGIRIAPRQMVTLCFMMTAAGSSVVRKATQFQ